MSAADLAPQAALVVTAYGQSPFLEDCLRSLSQQTVSVGRYLTTSTPSGYIDDLADAYGFTVIVNPVKAGIASDWNFALRATPARFVTLAHQDDTYRPTFVEKTLEAFAAEPRASLCFTGYDEIGDDQTVKTSKISIVKHALESAMLGSATSVHGARLRAFLSFGNPLPCSSVTFDLDKLAGFAFSGDLQSNLDWAAWFSLCQSGAIFARVPARLVGRRHNDLTETSRLILEGRRQSEDLLMFRRLWPGPMANLIAYVYRAGY